jgi:hypothetical protein
MDVLGATLEQVADRSNRDDRQRVRVLLTEVSEIGRGTAEIAY